MRQLLYVVRTRRRVYDLVEVALFFQKQLLVAGYTLRELGRFLVYGVERGNHDGVNTSQSGAHRLRLCTQQVDIAVKHCLVIGCCGGIDNHLARAVALRLILLHDFGPQQTCRTELGNLHEIVFRYTHVEFDAPCRQIHVYSRLYELMQVFITPGQCISQLLHDVCTRVVQSLRVHHDTTHVGIIFQLLHEYGSRGKQRCGVLASDHHLLDRVEAYSTDDLLLVVAFFLEICSENVGQFEHMTLTSAEADFHDVATDSVEKGLYKLRVYLVAVKPETERVDTSVKDVESLGIGFCRIVGDDVLAHIP